MHAYTAYGLTLHLPFPCPILPTTSIDSIPDVIVEDGPVPYQLAAPLAEDTHWQAEPNRFLWRGGRRAGRFLVEGGQHVTLQRNRAAEDELLGFHFLDAVLAAVLRQRGWLVLHANAAVTPTGAVAISGQSGAGKSTTLAALLAHGCTLLADDITALRLNQADRVEVLPGVPQLHLCEDAAHQLGQDIADQPRYQWQRLKAAVSTPLAESAAPVRTLYVLEIGSTKHLRIRSLSGAEKFSALQACIYGPLLPQEHPAQFPLFAAVTEQVAVYHIERSADRWTMDEIVEFVLHG